MLYETEVHIQCKDSLSNICEFQYLIIWRNGSYLKVAHQALYCKYKKFITSYYNRLFKLQFFMQFVQDIILSCMSFFLQKLLDLNT